MASELSQYDDVDGGVGWLFFAGTILGIAGIMRLFDAFWAFRYDGLVPEDLEGAVLGTSLTTYGWVWLVVAVVLLGSSFAVLNRSQFARWIGIIAGGLLAITAIWWMPFYPVWSMAYVLIGVLVVYGLAAHGGRQRGPRSPYGDPAVDAATVRAMLLRNLGQAADPHASHDMYAEDAVLEFPQSGERFEGVANFRAWRSEYPGVVTYDIGRIRGADALWVAELQVRYEGGDPRFGVDVLEIRDGKIVRETIYVGEPFDAPEWRARWRAEP